MGGGRTFLFTDLEGSTRLWEREPARMGGVMARHDALLRDAVEAHGGRVFKTLGDGVCAVFADAGGAVAAALAAQRYVRSEAWPVGPVAIRASLHAGPAEERDGDFFGTTLNRTARILELAHGGQVLLSASVCEAVEGLPAGADLRDLGEHRLRDLTQPERLRQLVHADLPTDFAPLRALDAMPHNLPLQLTAFLGRERELAEVGERVRTSRLTTLVGAGGCGKTRLALHAAADALPGYEEGTWLVELADLTDGALAVRALATVLGVRPEQGTPLARLIVDRIGAGRMLVVLDNCEHVIDEAASLAHDLLRRCAGLSIVATSREPLRIEGESVYAVAPLGLPAPGETRADAVLDAPACSLFVELARAANHAFVADADAARRVAAICRALDGIPLAIELAAACARRMDLGAIEAGLAHRFDLLRRGRRTAQPHHRTLKATLDWSYELLDADERATFRRLSVFAGGWTLDSLSHVLGERARFAHDRLVDHSLVERRGPRYRFLESIRAYAGARLAADPAEERDHRARHASFVSDLLERSRGGLYGANARQVADEIESEIDNLRSAFAWTLESDECFEAGLSMATRFWVFCWMRGYMPEGRRWLDRFLPKAAERNSPAAALGEALYGAGVLAKESGDLPTARRHYEDALALREGGGLPDHLHASTLSALANVLRIQGDFDRAQALYEDAIARHRELGSLHNVAGALNGLGQLEVRRGRLALAREHYAESLAIFREQGDRRGEVIGLSSLGEVEHKLGDAEAAYRYLREGFRLCRRQRDRHTAAGILAHLGLVARDRGEAVRALRLQRYALAMSWRQGALLAVCDGLATLAEMASDPARRDRLAGAAYELAERLGEQAEHRASADFEAGRAMDLDAAVRYALGSVHSPPG